MMRRFVVRWWRRGVFTALIVAIAAIGFEARDRPVRRLARTTRAALAAGRYAAAREAVERWVQLRPRSAEAQYFRAKVAIADGRAREIVEGLKNAEALGYPAPPLAALRALLDAQHGRAASARPVLARAFAEAHEPDPMLDEALARVYVETYDFAHAGAVLDRWAADSPTDPRPPLWHAKVHLRRNADSDVVAADYREALRRDPNSTEARLGLAEQLERAQRHAEAAETYGAFLKQRPEDAAGHLGAGRNALALGDEPAAARHLARALELDPRSAPAHLEHAKLDLRHGDAAAALAHLDRAVSLAPSDPPAHYQRALALKRLGRGEESAREHQTFAQLQRDRRVLEDLQERLGESPDDRTLQYLVARWMFDHHYDAEALQWARKILTDAPGHPETCVLLADYFTRHGQPEQAAAYRQMAAPGPPRPGPR